MDKRWRSICAVILLNGSNALIPFLKKLALNHHHVVGQRHQDFHLARDRLSDFQSRTSRLCENGCSGVGKDRIQRCPSGRHRNEKQSTENAMSNTLI